MANERIEFQMSDAQLNRILEACQPRAMIMLQCVSPRGPQETANDAWRELGKEMGFVWDTAEPVYGKGQKFFTAEVECRGVELGNGDSTGCNQSHGDCPTCGK